MKIKLFLSFFVITAFFLGLVCILGHANAASSSPVTAEVKVFAQSTHWVTYGIATNLSPGMSVTFRPHVGPGPVFIVTGIAGGANFINTASGLNINLKVSGTSNLQFPIQQSQYMALVY